MRATDAPASSQTTAEHDWDARQSVHSRADAVSHSLSCSMCMEDMRMRCCQPGVYLHAHDGSMSIALIPDSSFTSPSMHAA